MRVEGVRLEDAERAVKIKGSTDGVAVAPSGQRVRIDPLEDLSSREHDAPT